jgi:protein SCO1/2
MAGIQQKDTMMFSKSLRRVLDDRLTYVALGILVMGLFVVGYKVGSSLGNSSEEKPASVTWSSASTLGGAVVDPPHLLQDFTLVGQTDQPVSLSDLRGRVVLLFFGYTNCPDECPTTLANYTLVKKALGEDADRAAFVFISVDPKRDTPEVMADYLSHFDPTFIGMTGDEHTLEHIGTEYGLYYSVEAAEEDQTQPEGHDHDAELGDNYFVAHTSPSFLIDPEGYLRTVYFYGTSPDVMASGIQALLSQAGR